MRLLSLRPVASLLSLAAPLALAACSATWTPVDGDGDGVTLAQGDCNDADPTIYPGAQDAWYDGIDSNCDGVDDFDQDGDGFDAVGYTGPNGAGDDCWDDPTSTPDAYTASSGFPQLTAADVHPGATDIYYDDIDANCDAADDFDQDGDGYDSSIHPRHDGTLGDDCYDELDSTCVLYDGTETSCTYPLSLPFVGDPFDPADINPGETDVWYDGTDQDCGGNDDWDQDGDGYPSYAECDDLDASVFPNPDIPEVWYNNLDENCDGNDGDQDGDGYVEAGYAGTVNNMAFYQPGDCWDDPALAPDWVPVNGFPALTADKVNPGATETWYDGLDQDCAGDSDFDQDADGYATDAWPDTFGIVGDDCDDTAGDVNPGAVDAWYDGVDSNCDGANDYDQDGDGYGKDGSGLGTDCDDTRASVHPGVTESCATAYDDNCDGSTNDINATGCSIWYSDVDGDTYAGSTEECLCAADATYKYTSTTDCDDSRSAVHPGAKESCSTSYDDNCDGSTNDVNATGCALFYSDGDGDGYAGATDECICVATATYAYTSDTDCDDSKSGVHPGATESCSTAYDDNCDGSTNDVNATGCALYYSDLDGDGYAGSTDECLCTADATYTTTSSTDCDDTKSAVNPAAKETCATAYDDNCDGDIDDLNATSCTTRYYDADSDTYGTTSSECRCTAEGSYTALVNTDCDDTRSTVNPTRTETCDTSYDDNCDGSTNDLSATDCTIRYYDGDADGYGTATSECRCSASGSYTASNTTDCDDTRAAVSPAGTETCATSYDDNCDGSTNDLNAVSCTTYYYDGDSDGYGLVATNECLCTSSGSYKVTGTTASTTDCNDASSTIHPGATETCDDVDQDCDGTADNGLTVYYTDGDGDGQGAGTGDCATVGVTTSTDCNDSDKYVYTGAPELCDGKYNNCTGSSAWTTASESGKSSVSNGSTWTDESATLTSSSASSGTLALSNNDTLYLCGTTTIYGRVTATGVTATITAQNGAPTLDGGTASGSTIDVSGGAVTVSNLTLSRGSGTGGYGGTVYATAASAPSSGSYTVQLSSDTVKSGSATYGGDIAVDNYASVKATSTTIQSGTASQQGGGVWMNANSRFETATTSTISSSSAGTLGGGLYMAGGTFVAGPMTFSTNTATTSGGGVYMAGGTATLTGTSGSKTTFTSNTATNTSGGGLYVAGGTWGSTYNSFSSNVAGTDGGGVYESGGAITFTNTSTVDGSTAGDDGGGMYIGGGTFTSASGLTISDSVGSGVGGGIGMKGGTATLTSATITGNATDDTTGGGGIGMTAGTLTLTTSTVSLNTADNGYGGALYLNGSPTLTVNGGTITEGIAGLDGGDIYIDTTSTATFGTSASVGTTIDLGLATGDGGNVDVEAGTVGFTSTTFTNGLAQDGGGLLVNGGTVTLTNDTFNYDSAVFDGGGIYQGGGTVTATGISMAYNTATQGGAAWFGGTASLGGTLGGNLADDGGGIYVGAGTTTLSGATLTGNGDGDTIDGGGMYVASGATAHATSSVIYNGEAQYGGGVYLVGTLTCTGVSPGLNYGIYQNIATISGGGIRMGAAGASLTTTDCDFGTGINDNSLSDSSNNDIAFTDGTDQMENNDITTVCSGTACP